MEQTEVVSVHGALVRDGAWWWHPTAELLNDRTGVQNRSVALLSCGETADPPSDGVYADADALRVMLEKVDEAIVVAHSYGGTVVAELGDHPAVRALMYISMSCAGKRRVRCTWDASSVRPMVARCPLTR